MDFYDVKGTANTVSLNKTAVIKGTLSRDETVQHSPKMADLNTTAVMSLSGRVALVTGGGTGMHVFFLLFACLRLTPWQRIRHC